MNPSNHRHIVDALTAPSASIRLRGALAAGTTPDVAFADLLVARCGVEPDFFVRDMLTWALCRLPADVVVPKVLAELTAPTTQARSQALHTLSKIGDARGWPAVSAMVHDADDDVARAAWRAAVALVPPAAEAELARNLAAELGRGDREMALSLSRALVALGESVVEVLDAAVQSPNDAVRAHAVATQHLWADPDSGFSLATDYATRVAVTGRGD
ncbi:HEAT repeat domain-containing protein [Gordonia sp. TBRC 11910]|uniref:HEAT repeat domain-containing protein n=1 Tax=Gordonia asplenii TaxID=2725283 RepID=A0A848KWS1_9ACTN|nr:HEAT repeat domain-containing protein [Gordonia asplenii]NMO01315.1 HEAT repeat domain-containing protein [Gordonia asplenii]